MNYFIQNEWGMIIISIILMVGIIVFDNAKDNRFAKKVYNKTLNLPCYIEYRGFGLSISKEIKIFENTYFESSYYNSEKKQKKVIYFINGNAVACITITKYLIFRHYYIEYNADYNHSEFEDIMQVVFKACKKKSNEEFEELFKNDKRVRIYELKSEE